MTNAVAPVTEPIRAEDYVDYVNSLTYRVCRSFNCINDYEDLRSCGYLGLLDAIESYRSDRNVTFKNFAHIRITGAIIDGMRGLYAGSKKVVSFKRKMDDLIKKLGTEDSEVLAEHLGMSLEEFHKNKADLNKTCRASFSDLAPEGDSDGENLRSMFGDSVVETPTLDNEVMVNEIWKFIQSNYSERDYKIMRMLYVGELTLLEASRKMRLTESRVSQIHLKIITDVKTQLFKLPASKGRKQQ